MVRTFGRWDCINARQRERAKESRFAACASLLTSPATHRPPPKCGAFRLQPRGSPLRQTGCWRKADSNPRSHSHESFCRGAAEGRSRNDWLGSRIKLWSSREMAIGCAPSPRPVHGETEISNLVCSGREPELSVPLARDDTGVRNNLPPAARVQLRYQFPTRPAIVNEAAPEIAMPGSKRSISRR